MLTITSKPYIQNINTTLNKNKQKTLFFRTKNTLVYKLLKKNNTFYKNYRKHDEFSENNLHFIYRKKTSHLFKIFYNNILKILIGINFFFFSNFKKFSPKIETPKIKKTIKNDNYCIHYYNFYSHSAANPTLFTYFFSLIHLQFTNKMYKNNLNNINNFNNIIHFISNNLYYLNKRNIFFKRTTSSLIKTKFSQNRQTPFIYKNHSNYFFKINKTNKPIKNINNNTHTQNNQYLPLINSINLGKKITNIIKNNHFWQQNSFLKKLLLPNKFKKKFISIKLFLKKIKTLNVFYSKPPKFYYLFLSHFFFYNFDLIKRVKFKTERNLFNFSNFDQFNDQIVKLTKNSINLNESDVFNIDKMKINLNFFNIALFKTLSFINNSFLNDDITPDTFFNVQSRRKIINKTNKNFKNFFNHVTLNFFTTFFYPSNVYSLLINLQKEKNVTDAHNRYLFNKTQPQIISTLKTNTFSRNFFNFSKKIKNTENLKFVPIIEHLLFLTNNTLFFKFFFSIYDNNVNKNINFFNFFESSITTFTSNFLFFSLHKKFKTTNILPFDNFSFLIKKYVIKSFNFQKFPYDSSPWHCNTIIKFLEFVSGKKVYINYFTFINNTLTFYEKSRCELWSQKIKNFRKILGPRLFLNESLQILYISLKLKDPYFLANWIQNMLYKISFWKHKLLFRYLQYVLRYFFWPVFKELTMKGLKFQLKGKISVAGNARTRTITNKIGASSHATFNNKILSNLNLIKTFTGVLGFKTWLIF
jgi:hypothetical protein